MSTLVDFRGTWTYHHFMSPRRVVTPADLGAVVRESRLAARLTQAELAAAAGVSREWLLGLERGARPRAELGKVLAVLDALDLPLTIGSEPSTSEASAEPDDSAEPETRLSTAEVTRRAIVATRPAEIWHSQLRALVAPNADFASTVARASLDALKPALDTKALATIREGTKPTAGSLLRAMHADPARNTSTGLEADVDEAPVAEDEVQAVDREPGQESRPR